MTVTVKLILGLFGLSVAIFVAGFAFILFEAQRPPQGRGEYVALGSSFAAAPGVGTRAAGSPNLCGRSSANYPYLISRALRLDLTDVTCSGATTDHLLHDGQYFQRTQLDAVRAQTKLVTITVGGNDVSYIGNLFGYSCGSKPERVPLMWKPFACSVSSQEEVERAFNRLRHKLLRIVSAVRERAPDAKIVFVDYATVLPQTGSCPDRLPLTDQQVEQSRAVAARLAEITADVARHTRSLLVEASALTKAHHICSANPWVFGHTFPPTPVSWGPLAFHPNEKAMSAIAVAVAKAVTRNE